MYNKLRNEMKRHAAIFRSLVTPSDAAQLTTRTGAKNSKANYRLSEAKDNDWHDNSIVVTTTNAGEFKSIPGLSQMTMTMKWSCN